jgi:UDP-N-acetylmuramate dehydrogenase
LFYEFCAIFLSDIMDKNLTDIRIHENVALAPYTTLGVGGPARYFAVIDTPKQIPSAMQFARTHECPVFILGGGSNIVVSDSGYCGLVLKIEIAGIRHLQDCTQSVRLSVGAGVAWDSFVQYCAERNLAGIECLSGIPGTVGGVPIQNVGAYGQEAGETISAVEAWDRQSEKIVQLSKLECGFSYRTSIFNASRIGRYILLEVTFDLRPGGAPCLQYEDLKRQFSDGGPVPALQQVREAVLAIRKSKGMIVREEDSDSKSAGSFFRNPILTPAEFARLGESIPHFHTFEGNVKLSAARLIEHAGFTKGYVHRCAGLSGKHSLAIINRGGATAQNIVDLMRLIQNRVQEVFGIMLQPEPIFIGFKKDAF